MKKIFIIIFILSILIRLFSEPEQNNNLIKDGNFNSDSSSEYWQTLSTNNDQSVRVENRELVFKFNKKSSTEKIVLYYNSFEKFDVEKTYSLKFKIRAEKPAKLYIKIGELIINRIYIEKFYNLTKKMKEYSFTFKVDTRKKFVERRYINLCFFIDSSDINTIYLDDVELIEVE